IRAGEVYVKLGDTAKAVNYYQDAKALALGTEGNISQAVNALRGLAHADRLKGNVQQARSSLDQAVNLIEHSRNRIVDPAQKTDYLDATHGVYEDLISLEAEPPLNDAAGAFAISEQSRGRTLLDQIKSSEDPHLTNQSSMLNAAYSALTSAHPVNLASLEAVLPSDLVLIEYAVTDDATYIFVVTRSGLRMVKSPVKTDKLNAMVSRYVEMLKTPASGDGWKSPARDLYDALILPVKELIPDDSTICIVPDRMLDVMSFAAILGPDEKCLAASNPLTYAPSASILKLCLDESRRYGSTPAKSILAVGNPAFDTARFPALQSLSSADREANGVASLLY
ncbi:MAG: CHAT domain-containing protein, partial [Blastocatellia bacterium]